MQGHFVLETDAMEDTLEFDMSVMHFHNLQEG